MAERFKALSNPVRLKLFMGLTQCCTPGTSCEVERCVGDLASLVNVAPSTLSHHIKALNQAGLIEVKRVGKHMMCCVKPETLHELSDYFHINT